MAGGQSLLSIRHHRPGCSGVFCWCSCCYKIYEKLMHTARAVRFCRVLPEIIRCCPWCYSLKGATRTSSTPLKGRGRLVVRWLSACLSDAPTDVNSMLSPASRTCLTLQILGNSGVSSLNYNVGAFISGCLNRVLVQNVEMNLVYQLRVGYQRQREATCIEKYENFHFSKSTHSLVATSTNPISKPDIFVELTYRKIAPNMAAEKSPPAPRHVPAQEKWQAKSCINSSLCSFSAGRKVTCKQENNASWWRVTWKHLNPHRMYRRVE